MVGITSLSARTWARACSMSCSGVPALGCSRTTCAIMGSLLTGEQRVTGISRDLAQVLVRPVRGRGVGARGQEALHDVEPIRREGAVDRLEGVDLGRLVLPASQVRPRDVVE